MVLTYFKIGCIITKGYEKKRARPFHEKLSRAVDSIPSNGIFDVL